MNAVRLRTIAQASERTLLDSNTKLYPTLALMVGERSFALATRIARWFPADVKEGFPVEKFSQEKISHERLWVQAKALTAFGLSTLVERRFVGVNSRTDVRIALICDSESLEELKSALSCCLEAQELWRADGRHTLVLQCQIVLFGSAAGDPLSKVRALTREVFPQDSPLPVTLYLSECQ